MLANLCRIFWIYLVRLVALLYCVTALSVGLSFVQESFNKTMFSWLLHFSLDAQEETSYLQLFKKDN
jgi:hypothetical protein